MGGVGGVPAASVGLTAKVVESMEDNDAFDFV